MRKIVSKLKEDKGNSVIVLGLIVMFALMIVGGTVTDVSKAYQMKSSQTEAARKATQAGIRIQTSDGFLEGKSILETVRVYNNVSRPSVINTDPTTKVKKSHFERCGSLTDAEGLAPRELTVWLTSSTDKNKVSEKIYFNLDEENVPNNQDLRASESTFRNKLNEINYNRKFDTININIVESTPNAILPLSSVIETSDGTKYKKNGCQRIPVKASASTFVGKSDIYN